MSVFAAKWRAAATCAKAAGFGIRAFAVQGGGWDQRESCHLPYQIVGLMRRLSGALDMQECCRRLELLDGTCSCVLHHFCHRICKGMLLVEGAAGE